MAPCDAMWIQGKGLRAEHHATERLLRGRATVLCCVMLTQPNKSRCSEVMRLNARAALPVLISVLKSALVIPHGVSFQPTPSTGVRTAGGDPMHGPGHVLRSGQVMCNLSSPDHQRQLDSDLIQVLDVISVPALVCDRRARGALSSAHERKTRLTFDSRTLMNGTMVVLLKIRPQ